MRLSRYRSRRLAACAAVAAVVFAGGAVEAASSAAAQTGCSVTYTVGSQWQGGFTASVAITNLGEKVGYSRAEFEDIIRATQEGLEIVSPYLANLHPIVLARLQGAHAAAAPAPALSFSGLNLSPREREIVDLLVLGKSNKEMADQLCLASDTIKAHLQHIFRKVGVSSRLEAVVFFLTGRRAS